LAAHIGVVETVFVDCKGFAAAQYVPLGRNVGSVKFVHGGVGRNVAENIAPWGMSVSLLSSIDQGGIGRDVACRLAEAGVRLIWLAELPECGMGMYVACGHG
jgi:pseudouridine kinase